MAKYLFIYRNPADHPMPKPSPEVMQAQFSAWAAWKEKFKKNSLELGDGLKPDGKIITKAAVTDGPFVEAKEIVGGYSIVTAASYDEATSIAKECPILHIPGAKIEVRELMGY